jgi:hypothetical protein
MGMSLHTFMVSTLSDAAQRKRLRQTFAQDSSDALAVMKATGTGHALEALMASPNSPTRGHPKFPQAAPSDYDPSAWMAKRAAASLSL